MASLLDKVATLIKANLHYLVDQALKQNSLAVIDQYIREVEDNLDKLEDAAATVGGQVKTLKRKFDEFQTKADELDRNIDILLQEGREELAVAAQSKLNSTQRLADSYGEQHARQKAEYEKLLDAKLKLEAKLTTIKQEREELQALLDLARAKELTWWEPVTTTSVASPNPFAPGWTRPPRGARWPPPAWTPRWMRCWSAPRLMLNWPNARKDWGWNSSFETQGSEASGAMLPCFVSKRRGCLGLGYVVEWWQQIAAVIYVTGGEPVLHRNKLAGISV
jgi:hypothetical protein